MDEIDRIRAPTNPVAKVEFENQRRLVKRHFGGIGSRFVRHSELIRDLGSRIADAGTFEAALKCLSVPTASAHKTTYDLALLKAVESRTAFNLLRTLLQRTCGYKCIPRQLMPPRQADRRPRRW
jgi:hypothetical protein